jgi:hypothetical protein
MLPVRHKTIDRHEPLDVLRGKGEGEQHEATISVERSGGASLAVVSLCSMRDKIENIR